MSTPHGHTTTGPSPSPTRGDSTSEDPDSTSAADDGGNPLDCLDVDPEALLDYANQPVPDYIVHDNTGDNPITDQGATLGRVLFYDVALSVDDSISCASCHQQQYAFSDLPEQSEGVAGLTHRHSMRLVNIRFGEDPTVRWDESATTLEPQTTRPIKDATEMGYSGTDGSPGMNDLIAKMEGLPYYPALFTLAFGDAAITEERMQLALAQFVRSIQSFDSRYDEGRSQVDDDLTDFPNFSLVENAGKRLFIEDFTHEPDQITIEGEGTFDASRRTSGGLNCGSCHRPPEFDIDPESLNNGFLLNLDDPLAQDFSVTRSPSLHDMMNPDAVFNGGMFHTGRANEMAGLSGHYNFRPFDPGNTNLDDRMLPGGLPQWLNISPTEQVQLAAFLETLTGTAVYTDPRWSDPFVCR
ncbi:MAG: cytochrome c peroxidase [Myxococcota bacterium]